MGGMRTYVETLQKPEAWSSDALKSVSLIFDLSRLIFDLFR